MYDCPGNRGSIMGPEKESSRTVLHKVGTDTHDCMLTTETMRLCTHFGRDRSTSAGNTSAHQKRGNGEIQKSQKKKHTHSVPQLVQVIAFSG